MIRNNIVFIGEENKTNTELFQLLNWRFYVKTYVEPDKVSVEEIREHKAVIMIVSLVNAVLDYRALFETMEAECADIPVVTIGTKAESDKYDKFYEDAQFHKILRPITGKQILDICKAVIAGKSYEEEIIGAGSQSDLSEEKPHILVVDDNAIMLRHIKGTLEGKYSVAVAPSGYKAFVSIGKRMPDLILLDYEMPEMNGKEVMEKIQEDEELQEIPIIFLTSADSKEIVMELLALKPAGYILKPVDSQVLFYKIEEIMGK